MATLDLDAGRHDPKKLAFLLQRSNALQQYSNLESSLCSLFAFLLQTPPEFAGIVFFRITSSRYRNLIIEDLLKKRGFTDYKKFWAGVDKLLRKLDQRRNEIVHWTVADNLHLSDAGTTYTGSVLTPPNIYSGVSSNTYSLETLADFCRETDFVSRLVVMFWAHLSHQPLPPPWPEIFQQPPTYPPPSDHPLSPTPKAPEPPPKASQG